MSKINRSLMLLALAVALVIGVVLAGGCTTPEPEPTQIILNLTPQQASDLIQNNANDIDFLIIDVRTPEEFAGDHIENAIMINFNATETFRDNISNLDRNKTYLIYCQTGVRSGPTLALMEELGFMEVYNMPGGLDAWLLEGLPVVTD